MNGYSELFIYKDCAILKNKNFKVDDIQEYLGSFGGTMVLNKTDGLNRPIAIRGQFFKHSLKNSIIIDLKQTRLENFDTNKRGQELTDFIDNYNFNYLAVRNIDERGTGLYSSSQFVYYFITGRKWASENSIALELEMDVINTLIDNAEDGTESLSLSPKTTILRQHKDRYERPLNNKFRRKIDFYSEGIFPTLYKWLDYNCSDVVLKEGLSTIKDENNWYLIYKSHSTDQDSPIDILLCADEQKIVRGGSQGYYGHKDPKANLTSREYWVIYGGDGNIGAKVRFNDGDTPVEITISSSSQCVFVGRKQIFDCTTTQNGTTINTSYLAGVFKNFRDVEFENVFVVRKHSYLDENISDTTISMLTNFPQDTSFPTTTSDQIIGEITEIDRTDPTLLKILRLPYCPIPANIGANNVIELPAGFGIIQATSTTPKLIVFENSNIVDAFHRTLKINSLVTPYFPLQRFEISNMGEKFVEKTGFDSKLYHSDYWQPKFVYDSFVYTFKLECCIPPTDDYESSDSWDVEFYMTSSMNSKMLFVFPYEQFETGAINNRIHFDTQDYSGVLVVARNNEVPIYNSSYLNYIRTAYNYDIKTKNRQLRNNIISGSLNTIGAVASAVSSVATGPIGWAGAVGLGIGATKSFYNAISQTAQAEQNISEKLKSTEMQGLSVAGSDDVDLLDVYTRGNKAKFVIYEVSDKMRENLNNLFYYTGYIANVQGIPDTTSRLYFNFVQAEVVFYFEQGFPQELLEELKNKYREGITFLHNAKYIEDGDDDYTNYWDFEQQYENWETSLILHPRLKSITPPSSTALNGREYVVDPNVLQNIHIISRLTNSGKLTWRRRRRDTLDVVEELSGLDTFTIKGDIERPSIDVRIGSSISRGMYFSDYAISEFYWTIEFSENTSGGYNQSTALSTFTNYIEYRYN